MKKTLIFLFIITLNVLQAQVIKKENLTRPDKMYYDFKKTKLLSTGAYYKDELGETKNEHGEWKYYSKDGKLEEVRNYYKGKLNGLVMLYWPNEKKKQEGYFKLDVQDSVYREWFENGNLQLEGTIKKDKKVGVWKSFYLTGKPRLVEEYIDTTRYVRSFWNSDSTQTVINGNGKMINRYLDNHVKEIYNFKDGLEDGDFVEYKINGDTAVSGSYNKGLKTGAWKQFFYNGKIEKIANYKDNLLDGLYQVFYDYGKIRTSGYYKEGKKSGLWTWYATNGAIDMKGTFTDDLQDGDWTYYYPDGKISYTAQFKQGKKDGNWNYYYTNGAKFKVGAFKDDEKEGNWKTWYESGNLLMDGNYSKGKEEGEWNNYWDGNTLKNKATFKAGKLNGAWQSFSKQGKLTVSGFYKNGYKDKTWTEYFDNGSLAKVETFKVQKIKSKANTGPIKNRVTYASVLNGPYTSYSQKDFKKTEEGTYKNDKKDGTWLAYYPGGKIVAVLTNYKEGKLSGDMRQFDQRGNILNETQYKEGVKHGTMKIFDKKGKVVKQKDFEYGEEKKQGFIPKGK
jgi:antitoxin component YwqK of YwqJK toxin-antitoxin module